MFSFYDEKYGEYFIDRHRPTFEVVLDYYIYGILRRPSDIPLDVFVNELTFYQLEKAAVQDFLEEEGILLQEEVKEEKRTVFDSKLQKIQFSIWECLEDPQSGRIAFGLSLVSFVLTVSSILMLCIDSLPSLQRLGEKFDSCHESKGSVHKGDCPKVSVDYVLFIMESVFNTWFSVELVIRFLSCEEKIKIRFQCAFYRMHCNIHRSIYTVKFYRNIIISLESYHSLSKIG